MTTSEQGGARKPVSITELARRLGMSRKTVTAHIERGTVPDECLARGPNGWQLLDADRAERAILDATAPVLVEECDERDKYAKIDFDDKRTWPRDAKGLQIVREYWLAHEAKRKADIAARELVRTADVHRELFTAGRTIRDELVTFPDRAADDLAAELGVADAACVRSALQKTIDRMLSDLAVELERALTAAGAGDEDEDAEADGGAGVQD